MKSVSAIIDSCSKALLGAKTSAPEGSKLGEMDKNTSESIQEGRERVFELIRREIPAYVHLVSVTATDYVGTFILTGKQYAI